LNALIASVKFTVPYAGAAIKFRLRHACPPMRLYVPNQRRNAVAHVIGNVGMQTTNCHISRRNREILAAHYRSVSVTPAMTTKKLRSQHEPSRFSSLPILHDREAHAQAACVLEMLCVQSDVR
jgi:hypothetical protein